MSTCLQDLIQLSASYDAHKADHLIDPSETRMTSDGYLYIEERLFQATSAYLPTDHALQQLCDKLGPPPYRYMKDCPADLRSVNINHWLGDYTKPLFIRAYKDHARAVLSSEYTPILNTTVLQLATDYVGDTPHWLIRPYVDPDSLHVQIAVADTNDGNFAIGVYIRNGETGNYAVQVSPFIQRHSCTNSIIHLKGGNYRIHLRTSEAFLRGMIADGIGNALKLAPQMVEKVVLAQMEEIPDLKKVISEVCKKHNLSQPIEAEILISTEGEKNLFGLVNGLSYAAHHTNDVDERVSLEALAGAYLME